MFTWVVLTVLFRINNTSDWTITITGKYLNIIHQLPISNCTLLSEWYSESEASPSSVSRMALNGLRRGELTPSRLTEDITVRIVKH